MYSKRSPGIGAVLVDDLAGLLVGLGVLASALEACVDAQGRPRHVRPHGQKLQRGDQRVAPEQGVEAARIARLDRRRAGVGPALGRQYLVEPADLRHDPTIERE